MRQPDLLTDLARAAGAAIGAAACTFALMLVSAWFVPQVDVDSASSTLLTWYLPVLLLAGLAGIVIAHLLKAIWLSALPGILVGFVAFWIVMFIWYVRTAS